MPNNHGLCITTRTTCWDVDAYKNVGIAQVDMDNGVCVVLGAINKDAQNNVKGYEFTVTAAQAASTGVWVVRTPEVGDTLEMQMYNDPRYFYNKAGKPMSLCYANPKVDHFEFDANCFVTGSAPADVANAAYATIGAGGKLVAATAAPASGCYFAIVGKHFVEVGTEQVPTWILRVERN